MFIALNVLNLFRSVRAICQNKNVIEISHGRSEKRPLYVFLKHIVATKYKTVSRGVCPNADFFP